MQTFQDLEALARMIPDGARVVMSTTAPPDAAMLARLRGRIVQELAETYPRFVTRVFPQAGAAA